MCILEPVSYWCSWPRQWGQMVGKVKKRKGKEKSGQEKVSVTSSHCYRRPCPIQSWNVSSVVIFILELTQFFFFFKKTMYKYVKVKGKTESCKESGQRTENSGWMMGSVSHSWISTAYALLSSLPRMQIWGQYQKGDHWRVIIQIFFLSTDLP